MKTKHVSHNIFTAWNIRVHIIDLQWAVWPYTKAPTVGPLQRLVAESLWAQNLKAMDLSWMTFVCSFACLVGKTMEDSNWHGVLYIDDQTYIYIYLCACIEIYVCIHRHTCLRWTHCYSSSTYMCNLNLSNMISQYFYCFASLGIPSCMILFIWTWF